MTRESYFQNTSYASRCTYESFNRKLGIISEVVEEIEVLVFNIVEDKYKNIELKGKKELLCHKFAELCELIYSTMEYLGYLIYIYQKRTDMIRGNWKGTQSSFHKIINCYFDKKEREKYALFKHRESAKVFDNIGIWYYPIRSIRSKEIHYNKGSIEIRNNEIFYINSVEYGDDHLAIEFDITTIKAIYNKFSRDTLSFINLIDNYLIKV